MTTDDPFCRCGYRKSLHKQTTVDGDKWELSCPTAGAHRPGNPGWWWPSVFSWSVCFNARLLTDKFWWAT